MSILAILLWPITITFLSISEESDGHELLTFFILNTLWYINDDLIFDISLNII